MIYVSKTVEVFSKEFWFLTSTMFVLFSSTIFMSTTCFFVLVIREYFQTLNEILAENNSREIINLHLQLCEVIPTFNKIFAGPMGFFEHFNALGTTFAIYEIYDLIITQKTENQIFFGVLFLISILHVAFAVFAFIICCSLAMSEMRKSLKVLKPFEDGRKNLRKNQIKFLQLQSVDEKFSCGLFKFNLKTCFEVRKNLKLKF